ncbi:amidohydrolase family protein [Microbacterium sp. NPDC008134]|uniref:amidohydrolase family protein n=1 Tax=Microbacterium sp. NPDC008134 TaxID=3364183 RepID=UPI0036E638A9
MFSATFFDGEGWREGVVDTVGDRMLVRDDLATTGLPRLDGVVTGGFTDHHVHLQLVETAGLSGSLLGRVVDLGANVTDIARLGAGIAPVRLEYAGAFLTAPGGYPSDRAWAPAGSVREIIDAAQAAEAVAEMADAGAYCVKVASNTAAGPVFGDELVRTIVDLAAARGLPVTAHAEGPGEAQRIARLGVARLAHAPFTEVLDDDEIAAQAASVAWISTLAIHEDAARVTAIDNVRRFHAAGGAVLYGTDMGNGPTPVDLNPAEVNALRDAGLDDAALLRALAPVDARGAESLLFFPGASPATADLLHARRLSPTDLKV